MAIRLSLVVTFILLSVACSIDEDHPKEVYSKASIDDIRTDMDSLHKHLRGYLYRKVMDNDLSMLDETKYIDYATSQSHPSEKEYIDFLNEEETIHKVKATQKDFAVCVKSLLRQLILCDRARTAGAKHITDMNAPLDAELNLLIPNL